MFKKPRGRSDQNIFNYVMTYNGTIVKVNANIDGYRIDFDNNFIYILRYPSQYNYGRRYRFFIHTDCEVRDFEYDQLDQMFKYLQSYYLKTLQ
jgi:hypothetical protein